MSASKLNNSLVDLSDHDLLIHISVQLDHILSDLFDHEKRLRIIERFYFSCTALLSAFALLKGFFF